MGLLICIDYPHRDSDKTEKTSTFMNASFLHFCFENAYNSVISNCWYTRIQLWELKFPKSVLTAHRRQGKMEYGIEK